MREPKNGGDIPVGSYLQPLRLFKIACWSSLLLTDSFGTRPVHSALPKPFRRSRGKNVSSRRVREKRKDFPVQDSLFIYLFLLIELDGKWINVSHELNGRNEA